MKLPQAFVLCVYIALSAPIHADSFSDNFAADQAAAASGETPRADKNASESIAIEARLADNSESENPMSWSDLWE